MQAFDKYANSDQAIFMDFKWIGYTTFYDEGECCRYMEAPQIISIYSITTSTGWERRNERRELIRMYNAFNDQLRTAGFSTQQCCIDSTTIVFIAFLHFLLGSQSAWTVSWETWKLGVLFGLFLYCNILQLHARTGTFCASKKRQS